MFFNTSILVCEYLYIDTNWYSIIFLHGVYGFVRKLIETHRREGAKKKKKRCEQNNAEDDSETFRGRIIQALRQLSIQSSPGWGQKKKPRRWHATGKLISLRAFHHSHIWIKWWLFTLAAPSSPLLASGDCVNPLSVSLSKAFLVSG